ncbi:cytochrome P450, partial [Ralstonia pseudosolanacearum]|uniref:cytochrome P450 n=1 Tax=Ralstonia pseudosolanacearum TaxID=1310165 RepID=UPI003CECAD98
RKYNRDVGLHALILETEELFGGFVVADFFPWLRWIHTIDGLDAKIEKYHRKLDEFCNKVIEEHLDPKRSKPEVEDLVDVMLRVQKEDVLKIKFTNDTIKGIIMDMFIAGTGSAAATMVWTMTALIKSPTIMKKAQEEVRAVVGNKPIVEESDLPRLNYLKLTLKEALRLHPPLPLLVPRETTEKCVIQGYDIPAKTR